MEILIILALVAAALVAVTAMRRRKERAIVAGRVEELRRIVTEDITDFGQRLARFDVHDPRVDDAGRTDLQRALDGYGIARATADRMRSESDTGRVTRALEDGRYALACLEARLDGRATPERRPPCLLDPRHGPSSEDIPWSVDGRPAEPTPMCIACAATVRRGEIPEARMLPAADGTSVPWYSANRAYAAPYAAGYYSPFAGVMPALFMGTMMGALLTPGFGFDGSYADGYADGMAADGVDAGAGDAGNDMGMGDFGGDFGGGFGEF